MITGVAAVAPSGDGGAIRLALSTAASSRAFAAEASPGSPASPVAVTRPDSSSAGSSTRDPSGGDPGDDAATGAYLARLLAASITGRAPEGAQPAKITPGRLASIISYLEAATASTRRASSDEAHGVDVTG